MSKKLSEEVGWFASLMQTRLIMKDDKWGGYSWKGPKNFDSVSTRWFKKVGKITKVLELHEHGGVIDKAGLIILLADLANYCMMLPDTIEEY